jgi:hypothetical protein
MANELQLSTSAAYTKVNDSKSFAFSDTVSVSGSLRAGGVQLIGTSAEETLQIGDVTSVGWVAIHNLDDTNFVQVATVPSEHFTIKLKAGEACMFRASGSAIYCKANSAACKVSYEVFSD